MPEVGGAARALYEGVGVAEGVHELDGVPAELRPNGNARPRHAWRRGGGGGGESEQRTSD